MDCGGDILCPVQVEDVKIAFGMIADLVMKRGDWQNWKWKEDFGLTLDIDDLGLARQTLFTPDEFDEDRLNEAQKAAARGDENVIAFVVYMAQRACILDSEDVNGRTLLHMVTGSCSAELCRLVMVKGGDEGHTNVWGDTLLHVVARYGRLDHLKAMLSKLTKAEVTNMYYRIPYRSIPGDGVGTRNNDGRMAIHLAAEACAAARKAVSILVKYGGADIDATVSCCCLATSTVDVVNVVEKLPLALLLPS